MNERPAPEKRATDEIDISDFFRMIGRALNKFGQAVKWIFVSLFNLLISFLLFIKKNFTFLFVGALIGAGIGAYIYITAGSRYSSSMTVRSNFDNNYFLYNQVEYYNALAKSHNYNELAKELNLTPNEASGIYNFSIEAVKNDYEAAQLYRDAFLRFKMNRVQEDTSWAKTLRFQEFKKTLTDFDYPLQQITLYSKNPSVYARIQQALVAAVNNNPELQKRKNAELQAINTEDSLLTESLRNIDTLRQVYNKTLTLEAEKPSSSSGQIIVGERRVENPELELYDKSLMIKDDLIQVKKRAAKQMDLMQIYSGFNRIGTKESSIYVPLMIILFSFLGTLALLLLFEFVRYLSRVEKTKLPSSGSMR